MYHSIPTDKRTETVPKAFELAKFEIVSENSHRIPNTPRQLGWESAEAVGETDQSQSWSHREAYTTFDVSPRKNVS